MENGTLIPIVAIAIFVVQQVWCEWRVNRLVDRLMAKNFEEFKYYKHKYPGDLKEIEKLRKDVREENKNPVETEIQFHKPETIKALSRFEEDWSAEEVDAKQLADMEQSDMEMSSDDLEKDNTKDTG